MTFIHVIDENDAAGRLADVYRAWKETNPGRAEVRTHNRSPAESDAPNSGRS